MSGLDAILAAYRRSMERYGEPVTILAPLRPGGGERAQGPSRARITDQSQSEIVAGIQETRRVCIILHDDLADTPLAAGLVEGAEIVWNDHRLYVHNVDIGTRRLAGRPIAYRCFVSGF